MTEEAKKIVETIKEAFEVLSAMELPAEEQKIEITRDAAMTLIAEVEQVTRERDAAIRDMQKTPITLCAACSHYHTEFCCAGGEGCEDICMTIACSMFEWRNIQEEG